MAMEPPVFNLEGSSLQVDKDFYRRIAASVNASNLVEEFIIPIRSGMAWEVPAGHVFRIVAVEGPQVADLNMWNLHDPRERMWAARTRQLESSHVSTFNRIWSSMPFIRPMATITNDSLHDFHDESGARVHDLLGSRCDPYFNSILTGKDFDYHCHSNLCRAVRPYALTEMDVHDVLNVFQVTGLNEAGQYYMKPSPAKQGDFLEFFAEIDLLCALSTCPGGDLSIPLWGPGARDPIEVCRPLGIEIYKVDESLLSDWSARAPAYTSYKGGHGLIRRDAPSET